MATQRVLLANSQIAELLAREAESREGILVRAFRRAARSAFLWPETAADLVAQGRELTELHGVGPFIAKEIAKWIGSPPKPSVGVPSLRSDFLTLADARKILGRSSGWAARLRGDLQMHTTWSDGSGSIADMAEAATQKSYEYIGITDHSKGLKIAGGIDEKQLAKQQREIAGVNKKNPGSVTVLASWR